MRGVFVSLAVITAIHVAGLLLFTQGFFSTRFELKQKSQCAVSPTPVNFTSPGTWLVPVTSQDAW
jgi:hypothetical protein